MRNSSPRRWNCVSSLIVPDLGARQLQRRSNEHLQTNYASSWDREFLNTVTRKIFTFFVAFILVLLTEVLLSFTDPMPPEKYNFIFFVAFILVFLTEVLLSSTDPMPPENYNSLCSISRLPTYNTRSNCYRKALRMMKYADHHGFPIVTFVDNRGAFADLRSEELGQGEAIAHNLRAMFGLKVPNITIVTGEGGSGGALSLPLDVQTSY